MTKEEILDELMNERRYDNKKLRKIQKQLYKAHMDLKYNPKFRKHVEKPRRFVNKIPLWLLILLVVIAYVLSVLVMEGLL